MKMVPDQIRGNGLAKILDDIRLKYGQLSHNSSLLGLVITDSDAKVLATNTFFDTDINYWDVGAIGAALYGIGKQARDFFSASEDKMDNNLRSFEELKSFVHNENIPILIQLNKRDLEDAIPEDRFRRIMRLPLSKKDSLGFKIVYPAVAIDRRELRNVKRIFIDVIQKILRQKLT